MADMQEYIYKLEAIAGVANVTRPVEYSTSEQAKSELVGASPGYQSSMGENFSIEKIMSFGSAHTEVTGNEGPDGVYNTFAVSVVEKLNILDMVTADVVTARLTGEFHQDDYPGFKQPVVSPLGSSFVNLRIGGHPFEPKLPKEFTDHFDQRALFAALRQDRLERNPDPCAAAFGGITLHIPGFGTITFASLTVEPDPDEPEGRVLYTLTMVGCELGSPVEAICAYGRGRVGGGGAP